MAKLDFIKLFWVIILLCETLLDRVHSSRVKPEKSEDENCGKIEKRRSCSLQSINGTWQGIKTYEYPKKFVLLWPMPFGNFENARRVCEACNLEVAEIWDEDDHEQIIDIIKYKYKLDTGGKFSKATFWLGAVSNRVSAPANYKWTYQDGSTSVRFHHLRLPESWDKSGVADSGLNDKDRDCIVIGPDTKDPTKILWYTQSCDQTATYAVCQFKRKYGCDDALDTVPFTQINYTEKASEKLKDEIKVKPQPYYISSYPLSWRLAKEECEQQNKSLLFLQNEEEQQRFRKIFLAYLADKPQYFHTDFWIAAKFHGIKQYDRLSWWIQEERIEIQNWKEPKSGGISKTWGVDPYSENKAEPLDPLGRNENCVYVKFFYNNQKSTSWYTADCDQTPKFFICRDDTIDPDQKSSVEYCQANKYVKREIKDCKWNLILKKQKPDCVCAKGVHGLTDHQSCNSRLLVGDRCIKLHSKGVLHWKILGQEMVSENTWLIAQSRNRKAGRFIEWFSMKLNSSRQLFGNSNIYYSGLSVTLVGTSRYCFQKSSTGKKGEFYEIKIRNETSKVSFKEQCESGTEVKARKHKIGQPGTNECELKPCKRQSSEKEADVNPFKTECSSSSGPDDKCEYKEIVKKREGKSTTIRPEVIAASELSSKNIDVNQQMLMYAIDTAFYNSSSLIDMSAIQPASSWSILYKLFSVAKEVCSCMVPESFLDKALEMFKVAHYGQAYEYNSFFSKSEESQILNMLSECQAAVGDENTVVCEKNTCNNRVNKLNFVKMNGEITEKYLDDTGYQGIHHHHVMEAIWDVIDIWNVACIKQFRPSYLLYHHLEQGMEALFTDELRKLWHFPNLDSNFYKKLLGPMESTYLMNLHHCASAVYAINPKVLRLGRPKVPPAQLLGKRIRERKTKEHLISTGYSDTENEVVNSSGDNSTSDLNKSNDKSPVFCSRDQYCMKW